MKTSCPDCRESSTGRCPRHRGEYLPDPTRSATERGGAVVLASSPLPSSFTMLGKPHEFNTRRMYAADGQRISWAVYRNAAHHRTVVVFNDHARGIDGVVDLHFGNLDIVGDEWVLRAYDDHHWYCDFALAQQLRDDLKAGAR